MLVTLGAVFALNAMGITDINLFFKGWWTLLIIVPSAIGMFTDKDKTGAVIGLTVGLFLLLGCRGFINFRMLAKLIIPIVIIIIGLELIFGGAFDKKKNQLLKSMRNVTGFRHCTACFSTKNDTCAKQIFNGAGYVAVAGRIDGDISEAVFDRNVLINVKNVVGTVNITVPNGVNIEVISHALFGGVTNPVQNNPANQLTVYVEAYCLLGNVEIKTPLVTYNPNMNANPNMNPNMNPGMNQNPNQNQNMNGYGQ